MPFARFFATKADLAPGLEALQKVRPLQFVRCWRGRGLDGPTLPAFTSLLEATDLDQLQFQRYAGKQDINRLDLINVEVLAADATVNVEERLIGAALPGRGTIHYYVKLPGNEPVVTFTPCGMPVSSRILVCGEIEAGYIDAREIRLYEQMIATVFSGFKRYDAAPYWLNAYYGPQALALGAGGVQYAYETGKPGWTYGDLIAGNRTAPSSIHKPESGRLSLEESWNWLDEVGYKMPRNADGTPHPYTRRPNVSDDPDKGFSFFRTGIDEYELDHLTIPRTYIGKTKGYRTTFRQSDLSRSRFAADLFAYCDFSGADLSGALIASFFLGCTFDGAIWTRADLRQSAFEQCTFIGTKMKGATLLKGHAEQMALSEQQKNEVVWCDDPGPYVAEF